VLSLAEDYMVWNITKDEIRTRLAVVEHHSWGPPPARKPLPGNPEGITVRHSLALAVKLAQCFGPG